MQPFKTFSGLVAPVDKLNVDTDQIIPKQFLKMVERVGFGEYLFFDWRFGPDGTPRSDFVLNDSRYKGASVLLARSNFGCGSSREHAVWALHDFGFKAIIAPSFADIFYNNAIKNGLLPAIVPEGEMDSLFSEVISNKGYRLEVNLERQALTKPDGRSVPFKIDSYLRYILLEGLDEIGLTLRHASKIEAFEKRMAQRLSVNKS